MKTREFLLRSVPYLLSFIGGIVIFLISVHVTKDENWIGLLSNVAASLLAIPLIFFFYDYSNYRVSGKVNKTLADSMTFEINSFMLKLMMILRAAMGVREKFTWKSIQAMLNMRERDIKANLKITARILTELKTYEEELDELTYKAAKSSVLESQQIQTLESLVKELSHLIHEKNFTGGRNMTQKRVENILGLIGDWFDSCEREAVRSHQHFQLAGIE